MGGERESAQKGREREREREVADGPLSVLHVRGCSPFRRGAERVVVKLVVLEDAAEAVSQMRRGQKRVEGGVAVEHARVPATNPMLQTRWAASTTGRYTTHTQTRASGSACVPRWAASWSGLRLIGCKLLKKLHAGNAAPDLNLGLARYAEPAVIHHAAREATGLYEGRVAHVRLARELHHVSGLEPGQPQRVHGHMTMGTALLRCHGESHRELWITPSGVSRPVTNRQ